MTIHPADSKINLFSFFFFALYKEIGSNYVNICIFFIIMWEGGAGLGWVGGKIVPRIRLTSAKDLVEVDAELGNIMTTLTLNR